MGLATAGRSSSLSASAISIAVEDRAFLDCEYLQESQSRFSVQLNFLFLFCSKRISAKFAVIWPRNGCILRRRTTLSEAMQGDAVESRRSSTSDGAAFSSWNELVVSDFGKISSAFGGTAFASLSDFVVSVLRRPCMITTVLDVLADHYGDCKSAVTNQMFVCILLR